MKIMTATVLSMALILIGVITAQSKSMDGAMDKTDDMGTTQSMKHTDVKMKADGMKTDDSMHKKQDKMKMETDDMEMKSDDTMKDDGMTMKKS